MAAESLNFILQRNIRNSAVLSARFYGNMKYHRYVHQRQEKEAIKRSIFGWHVSWNSSTPIHFFSERERIFRVARALDGKKCFAKTSGSTEK